MTGKQISAKKRAALQQSAVNDLLACLVKLEKLVNHSSFEDGFFLGTQRFAEGQLCIHLEVASQQLNAALDCFEDCAEEAVEIQRVPH